MKKYETNKPLFKKSFSVGDDTKGWKIRRQSDFSAILTDAARHQTYIETVCPSRSDTFHRQIKCLDKNKIAECLISTANEVLRKLRIRNVTLAFDTTKEPYWGKNGGLNVRQTKQERGTVEAFTWIVVSIVKPKSIPLLALPYVQGADLADLVIEVFERLKSFKFSIKRCLFDRGFYIAHLISYLEANQISYLILAPANCALKRYADCVEKRGAFPHQMRYSRDMSAWKVNTKIVIFKNIPVKDKKVDFFFATNLKTSNYLLRWYRERWQIETNYRVEDEANIKSKSTNYLIRYFYFLISLLLHLLWIVNKNLNYYVPFKKYLDIIEHEMLFDHLEIEQI